MYQKSNCFQLYLEATYDIVCINHDLRQEHVYYHVLELFGGITYFLTFPKIPICLGVLVCRHYDFEQRGLTKMASVMKDFVQVHGATNVKLKRNKLLLKTTVFINRTLCIHKETLICQIELCLM